MNNGLSDTLARRLIQCYAGSFEFGMDLIAVRRIQGSVRLREPDRKGCLAGWLSGPAEEIPVYDAAALFGLPPGRERGAVLVLSRGAGEIGLSLNRVAHGSSFTDGKLLAVPPVLKARAFQSVVVSEGRPMLPVCEADLLPVEIPIYMAHSASRTVDRSSRSLGLSRSSSAGKLLMSSPFEGTDGSTVRLALSFTQVLEVLAEPEVARLPGGAPDFAGVLHWRNRLIPVLDPGSCVGVPIRSGRIYGRVLVVRNSTGQGLLAIPAGADTGTVGIETALEPALMAESARNVRFAFQSASGTVVIPDVDSILVPQISSNGRKESLDESDYS